MAATSTVREITRAEIEEFLYEEAALLDAWRLREWFALLTDDATYEIPSTDTPDGDSRTSLFIIADTIERIRSRVNHSWAKRPGPRILRRGRAG
jgi:p-cumate 2,3-dioxygenase subunit beta